MAIQSQRVSLEEAVVGVVVVRSWKLKTAAASEPKCMKGVPPEHDSKLVETITAC